MSRLLELQDHCKATHPKELWHDIGTNVHPYWDLGGAFPRIPRNRPRSADGESPRTIHHKHVSVYKLRLLINITMVTAGADDLFYYTPNSLSPTRLIIIKILRNKRNKSNLVVFIRHISADDSLHHNNCCHVWIFNWLFPPNHKIFTIIFVCVIIRNS